MVGNKAQKAVAAALTGIMALGSAAPAFAGTEINSKWTRLDGKYTSEVTTIVQKDGVEVSKETKKVTTGGENRYDTMFELVDTYFKSDDNKFVATDENGNVVVDENGKVVFEKDAFGKDMYGAFWGDDIVLVAGDAYADALSANGLAGALRAPIVSTPGDKLGQQAKDIIAEFVAAKDAQANKDVYDNSTDGVYADKDAVKASVPEVGDGITVYIVGGTAAVAAEVEDEIRALSIANHVATYKDPADETKSKDVTYTDDKGKDVKVNAPSQPVRVLRVAGSDRTETSLKVLDEINKYVAKNNNIVKPTGNGVKIYAVNGWAPYDALSVSSFAYRAGDPILLTGTDGHLTDAQVDYLKNDYNDFKKLRVTDFEVIGGPASAAFQDAIDANIPFASETITSGEDRYETSKLVIQKFGRDFENVVVATGRNWADALVGAPFAVVNNADIALVGDAEKDANWDSAIKAAVNKLPQANKGYILGGTSAVNKSTEDRVVAYIK